MLKSSRWVGGVVAPKIIASAPVPFGPFWALLGLELGWTGLGLGLGGIGDSGVGDLGLTILHQTLTLSLVVCDDICHGTSSFSSGSTKTPLAFQNKNVYVLRQTRKDGPVLQGIRKLMVKH